MAQYPADAEVLKAVEDAGWLLEQQAVRTLEARGFNPRPSWAFPDPDQPATSRELDVWSSRMFYENAENKIYVSASVLVECKQSETPYCAIGQDLPQWRQAGNPTEHTLPVRYVPRIFNYSDSVLQYGYTWDVLGFRALSQRHGQDNFRLTQLTRMERKGPGWIASNAGIFTSLVYPLAKAVRASQQIPPQVPPPDRWPRPGETGVVRDHYIGYALCFPVILISCPLYVVDAGSDQPTIKEASWVRVQRHLDSEKLKGLFEFDVVTRESFAKYVDTVVEGIASSVAETVAPAPLTYTGERFWPQGAPKNLSIPMRFPPEQWA